MKHEHKVPWERKYFCLPQLLPKIRPLAEDRSDHVRKALAETIMGLAVVLGEEKTKEHLLPLILHLLKDIESQVSRLPVFFPLFCLF